MRERIALCGLASCTPRGCHFVATTQIYVLRVRDILPYVHP
jgi:hypothetical protein